MNEKGFWEDFLLPVKAFVSVTRRSSLNVVPYFSILYATYTMEKTILSLITVKQKNVT
jgi:hypothetical protein